ncbi:MAG: hypothetical protein A2X77_03950 [Gammaproteobacteria bacterium GWE2_42_36]|nr:MAG: hypothetical protein A2X77_03950 [Gammaproteobacteria bacterium GWE2_42_36]HCU04980.1 hypothetical protein [Coxiellaceae bacterium]
MEKKKYKPRSSYRQREKNNLRTLVDFKKHNHFVDLFSKVREESPRLIEYLLHDLLSVEGYSENEIAFALGLPLHLIRQLSAGDLTIINRDIFLALFSLYARVFCGWCSYHPV